MTDGHPADDQTALAEFDAAVRAVEAASVDESQAAAAKISAIVKALDIARERPETLTGPWRGNATDHHSFAERAAVAELAVRLRISETNVRSIAAQGRLMTSLLPQVWTGFQSGEITAQKARIITEAAETLPGSVEGRYGSAPITAEDSQAANLWNNFDAELAQAAARLTPPKLRTRARTLRESLHPEPLAERHKTARNERHVYIEPARDGMSWLMALLPADAAAKAYARIDANSRRLCSFDGESRTLAQTRADVTADLLTGAGTDYETRAAIHVTVPVLSLTDENVEGNTFAPGFLHGYGPIDAETARRLAAGAPSFHRILTNPIDSAVLDLDRTSYRPPADLKRWLALRDGGCVFPGCNRNPVGCDVDHTIPWADGGTTSHTNLAHLCRHHHGLKHNTSWALTQDQATGQMGWTSPTGKQSEPDPPWRPNPAPASESHAPKRN